MTPIGVFSVDAGVGHQFEMNPKGYLTAVFRYVSPKRGLVEAGYLIRTDRRVEPALDGQSLAPAKGGTLRIDATDAEPGETTRLTVSDTPQDSPVPSTSAPGTCPDSGVLDVVLPEVSVGDSVTDTVTELTAACLRVQYASEESDASEGAVTKVEIPTTGPEGTVRLPRPDETASGPGPGDKVEVAADQAATVFVATPAQDPSPSDTATGPTPAPTSTDSPTPTDDPTTPTTPTDPTDTATTTVIGQVNAPVRSEPSTAGVEVSHIVAQGEYQALCFQRGEEVSAHGSVSDIWVKLLRTNGETGWVTATALSGDPETVVPTAC
ncbi:SH3 domain-containing protein [Streptomyces sp. NPDC059010]|uniref:SH3 domain-containing protein n=1 Tax=Streptomyces sp. NPDC059010 TaxID=3346695 RepID=UPI003682ACBD